MNTDKLNEAAAAYGKAFAEACRIEREIGRVEERAHERIAALEDALGKQRVALHEAKNALLSLALSGAEAN
jgi:hypothetical protein